MSPLLPPGRYLASVRKFSGRTLRQIKEETGGRVSDSYLSQVETGRIRRPSPNILHSLALVYQVDYGQLMERFGYVDPAKGKPSEGAVRWTLGGYELTPAEEESLLEYLEFLRWKGVGGAK